jgi:hypothetical protein
LNKGQYPREITHIQFVDEFGDAKLTITFKKVGRVRSDKRGITLNDPWGYERLMHLMNELQRIVFGSRACHVETSKTSQPASQWYGYHNWVERQ